MRAVLMCMLMAAPLIANTIDASSVAAATQVRGPQQTSPGSSATTAPSTDLAEFDRLRTEGFSAVYNIDYKTARERFLQMTRLAPDHPAGYVYLANNLWLETLYQSRRLTTSVYTGGSFYSQDKDEDKVDPKRDRDLTITSGRRSRRGGHAW